MVCMGILVGSCGLGEMGMVEGNGVSWGGMCGYSGDLVYIMSDWSGDLVGL